MLTQEQVQALRAPFPAEALKPDTSRGFELTSIKAAYGIERLNEVLGLCGTGWRYSHSPFEDRPTDNGRLEVVTGVALVKAGVEFPDGEADMLQLSEDQDSESDGEL